MLKFIFKWGLRLFLVGVVLVVVFLLSLDTILRTLMEHNIRAQTGLEAEIGKVHMGLLEPVMEIKDLKLHNPAEFGGTPFLIIPEIYAEYDRPALSQGELHVTLLRFNLGELDIVKNEKGQTNIFSIGLTLPSKDELKKNKELTDLKKRTGLDFKGIDMTKVSVGTFKYIDLKNPTNNRTQVVGLTNVPVPGIKTEADLAGIGVLIMLRSDNFFDVLVDQKSSGASALKQLGF